MKNESNYNKYPIIIVPELFTEHWENWLLISQQLNTHLSAIAKTVKVLVVECYHGVLEEEVINGILTKINATKVVASSDAMYSESEINRRFEQDVTDDEIFGFMTRAHMSSFFDPQKVEALRKSIAEVQEGIVIVYGIGAAYLQSQFDCLAYVDMARWEIQLRFRKNLISNIGIENKEDRDSLQYKRAFFVDWRVCDRFKKSLMQSWDYVLDTNIPSSPKMVTGKGVMMGLHKACHQPFRVVPYFDSGPWGGQWMKEVCDLDPKMPNYAWCFDCVPEENSLYLQFGDMRFEIPSINLMFAYPKQILGDSVYGRFGDEFPIRFDFLDTMGGGNLSLQVHPITEYIQEKFGMHYTQDESYYMLDTKEDAVVYLGMKENVNPEMMIQELIMAQYTGVFDVKKHIGIYPVKKHDHILIPAGTIHCSGSNSMVLEISATPYIFTFKLWDWARLGLDGRPRPINIEHGEKVIQYERKETWVQNELLNQTKIVAEGDGWVEEHTGLHEREFIETRRHWFTKKVHHTTDGSVNVLNLIEGREVIVESPSNVFEPYIVHYAETFIVPSSVKEFTIRPYGESEGKRCATIKAFIKHHA